MSMQSSGASAPGSTLDSYCRILDALPAAGAVCAADGRLVHYSERAAELWGRRPALDDPPRYCGALALRGLDGRPIPPERTPMARALREKVACHGERVRIERPDGSQRVVVVYASPVLDSDGEVHGGLNLLVDVTEPDAANFARAEQLRQREELRVALACDIRAGLDPLRRTAQDLVARAQCAGRAPADVIDRQLRHVTQLVDRLLNLEVDLDDATA